MASYNDEKRELLKMKQGLIEESDIIETEADKVVLEKPTGMKAVENFFYHNKWFVIVGAFFALVLTFLIYQTVTREVADMTVVLVTSDIQKSPNIYEKTRDVELALEKYCPDFDKNGKVHVDVFTIDLTKTGSDPQYITTNATKFHGEMQRGLAQMLICDKDILGESEQGNKIEFDPFFKDLGKATKMDALYGKKLLKLKDTDFAKEAKWENSCPDTLGFCIRDIKSDQLGYSEEALVRNEQAIEVLTNILTGTVINEIEEDKK
jgi:hypothetical protein